MPTSIRSRAFSPSCAIKSLALLACLLLPAACSLPPDAPYTQSIRSATNYLKEPPCNVHIFGLRVPHIKLQTSQALVVALATVVEVQPARWTTPDGRRPQAPCSSENQHGIVTPVLLEVEEVLKGADLLRELYGDSQLAKVILPGGRVGLDSTTYSGEFLSLQPGDRRILFLHPLKPVRANAQGVPPLRVSDTYAVENRQANDFFYEPVPLDFMLNVIRRTALTDALEGTEDGIRLPIVE